MKEFPYFDEKLGVNETNKIKWRESIFDKILKQVGHENDKCHVKYNQDLDIYYNGKDEKVIVKEAQTKKLNREGNKRESQQLTWMRLIKSWKKQIKPKE